MRTLVVVLVAVGALFGAVEVAVAAAADGLGAAAAAGPLLGIWGAGSLLGGMLAVRLGGGAHAPAGLSLVLAALTAGHLAARAGGRQRARDWRAVLAAAGAAIAPTYATVYAMVDRAAPEGTATEAFAWLATAVAIGAAAAPRLAGALADGAGRRRGVRPRWRRGGDRAARNGAALEHARQRACPVSRLALRLR